MNDKKYPTMIKELPEDDRPREKLKNFGAESLGNSELLAIILGGGLQGVSALTLANRLIKEHGSLRNIAGLSFKELTANKGIGTAKAAQILASCEISRRINLPSELEKVELGRPETVARFLMERYSRKDREIFGVIALDTKNRYLKTVEISVGSLNASLVHPREVFRNALKESAASLLLFHNHPSGDPSPSSEDRNLTKKLSEAGKLMGIEVLDHIVLGDGRFISFRQEGLI